jgi:hypothetical protein
MASTTVSNAGPVSVTTTSHGAETRPVELNEAAVQDTHAKLAMMLMSACWTPAAALRVVVELNIPHILATQAPAPKHTLTSEEILQHVADATKPNARNLERTMRLLTCKSVFSEEVEYSAQGEQQVVVRRYGLTPLSRVLVPGHSTGSVANFVKFATVGPVYGKALAHLRCARTPPSFSQIPLSTDFLFFFFLFFCFFGTRRSNFTSAANFSTDFRPQDSS